ncbi:nucleotidyltransferase family protein [bacterium]|nr:nucleotidyltransferase family protein [bacterium]
MSLLVRVLRDPEQLRVLSESDWSGLTVQARASRLLGAVAWLAQRNDIVIPEYAAWHYRSALTHAEQQHTQALWELYELAELFEKKGISWAVLKGGAYVAAGLPFAVGRSFVDVDILVPRDKIEEIERSLRARSWLRSPMNDYDERYYREWMHEIPPLRHAVRGTVLDVHHNLIPITHSTPLDMGTFSFKPVELPWGRHAFTLENEDLFIHSAVHLLSEGEFHSALRDLWDLWFLLQHFDERQDGYVPSMLARAEVLGLVHFPMLALRLVADILETKQDRAEHWRKLAGKYPDKWGFGSLVHGAFCRVIGPNTASERPAGYFAASQLLYWRSHSLKMPLRLLLPHLIKKLYFRLEKLWKFRDDDRVTPL